MKKYKFLVLLSFLLLGSNIFSQKNMEIKPDYIAFDVEIGTLDIMNFNNSFIDINCDIENTQWLSETGEPNIPSYVCNVLLPGDIILSSIECLLENEVYIKVENPNKLGIQPVPPLVTWVDGKIITDWPEDKVIVDGKDIAIYNRDVFWPYETIKVENYNNLRNWIFVKISIPIIQYNPVSTGLKQFVSGRARLNYKRTDHLLNAPNLKTVDNIGRKWIERECFNYSKMIEASNYEPINKSMNVEEPNGYVIITTNEIKNGLSKLDDFVLHKQSLGYNVQVITDSDFGGGTGNSAAENIRTWLQTHYLSDHIEYVLLIGNPNPSTGNLAMKMLYPRNYATTYKDSPSDFYFADLTGNWDLDGDGFYGEYPDDFGFGGVDCAAEVLVGRIPFYGQSTDADSILAKTINYESKNKIWNLCALLAMKPSDASTPGYHLGEAIKNDFIIPNNWTYHRIYDAVYGLNPPPETTPTTYTTVKNTWIVNPFGLVIWWTHGSATDASDIMSSSNAVYLNDEYPSFTFQVSCYNSEPEYYNNLSYALLKNGGICTIGATRVSWYSSGQTYFKGSCSNAGMSYEYASNIISKEFTAGEALYDLKQNLPNAPWMNKTVFNIYGDPSLAINECEPHFPPEVENVQCKLGEQVPDLVAIGENIKWYKDDGLTNLVHEGESFATGQTEPGTYAYYVTQTINACESPAADVSLSIVLFPPIANNVTICESEEIPYLNAIGENIRWYKPEVDTFADIRDGQTYRITTIGNQTWMAENLNFFTPEGSWYYYNDSSTYAETYGRLYNWETAQQVCPADWHVPNISEWDELGQYLGGNYIAGGKLKEAGTLHWNSPNTGATNETGFTGLPGGYLNGYNNEFSGLGSYGNFWSSEMWDASEAYLYTLSCNEEVLLSNNDPGYNGNSVRCLNKDFYLVGIGDSLKPNHIEPGSYTYNVTQTIMGYESPPVAVTLTINPVPSPPIAHDRSVCEGIDIDYLSTSGNNVIWYDDPELTNVISRGNDFYVHDYPTQLGENIFYITQSMYDCVSLPDTLTYTINPIPPVPIAEDVMACENETQPILVASGENITWYQDHDSIFIDSRDGKSYKGVQIGSQAWMAENLNYYTPQQSSYYNNDSNSYAAIFGRLYNFQMAQVACPTGWHVPSMGEWQILIDYLGGDSVAGGKLKEDSELYWYPPNEGASNEYQFTALPGGYFGYSEQGFGFNKMGENAYFWTSKICYKEMVKTILLSFDNKEVKDICIDYYETQASVRCICDDSYQFEGFGDTLTVSNTETGTYRYYVTQTILNCESPLDTVTLTINPIPVPPITYDITVCGGDNIPDLTAVGENIRWYSDPGLTNLLYSGNSFATGLTQPGTYMYYVTQTISDCESQGEPVRLLINTLPLIYLGNDTTINTQQNLTLSINNTDYSYLWSNGSDMPYIEISGSEIGLGDHLFWLEVTDSNTCIYIDTIRVTVVNPTHTPAMLADNRILIYPNPSGDYLTIEFHQVEPEDFAIQIINQMGIEVYADKYQSLHGDVKLRFDIMAMPKGYYTLLIQKGKNRYTEKLIIY